MNRSIVFFVLTGLVILLVGCNGDDKPKSNVLKEKACALKVSDNLTYSGEKVEVKIESSDKNKIISSVILNFSDTVQNLIQDSILIPELPLGRHRLTASITFTDSTTCSVSKTLELISNIKPEQYSYQVVNTFPHDPGAYTQGLLIHDNKIYEATGQWGFSDIRHYTVPNSEPQIEVKLGEDFFGEGITILNDKIYQLTYQAHKCFVYDLESFEKNGEHSYDGEGWGLTDDGVNLIMSNGTNQLRFIDPNDFRIIKTLYVYRGKKAQHNLNELEYANGKIFANIYQSEEVVEIDPETGEIVALVDFAGILDKSKLKSRIDAFNGIAHSPETGNFFVTGKWWPKLFEIRLLKS